MASKYNENKCYKSLYNCFNNNNSFVCTWVIFAYNPHIKLIMFSKPIILIIVLTLLIVFYLVIRIGAGKKDDIEKSKNLTKYLFGVRVLIAILTLVGLILWFFL